MATQPVPGCRFLPIVGKRSVRRIGIIKLRHHFETRAQAALGNHIVEETRRKAEH
jgi:hypothetical protein